jgi:ERF superfamily
MNTSETIGAFADAFAKVQAELQNPPKNKINPHFKSKYVDLSDGLDVIRKTLGKHGIAFIQSTKAENGFIMLHTRLAHKSGEWIESTYPVGGMGKHQEMGSALTYARRYSLFSLVGVAGEDDDDGNTAIEVKNPPKKEPAPKTVAAPVEVLDDSASDMLLASMHSELLEVSTREELRNWVKRHKENKSMLAPVHRDEISAAYREMDASLSSNG